MEERTNITIERMTGMNGGAESAKEESAGYHQGGCVTHLRAPSSPALFLGYDKVRFPECVLLSAGDQGVCVCPFKALPVQNVQNLHALHRSFKADSITTTKPGKVCVCVCSGAEFVTLTDYDE